MIRIKLWRLSKIFNTKENLEKKLHEIYASNLQIYRFESYLGVSWKCADNYLKHRLISLPSSLWKSPNSLFHSWIIIFSYFCPSAILSIALFLHVNSLYSWNAFPSKYASPKDLYTVSSGPWSAHLLKKAIGRHCSWSCIPLNTGY